MPISTLIQRAFFIATGATLVVFSTSDTVHAAAIDFTQPTVDFTNQRWTLGFQFRTKATITVNQLGFYDDLGDGLNQPQDVQILDATGNFLVGGTIAQGNAASLQGWFRYTSVTPTVLAANQVFTIFALDTGTDRYTWNPIGFEVDPAIEFLRDVFQTIDIDNPSNLPPASGGVQGWFGPNFEFEVTPIPTPALLPGLIGIGISVWRKRQQAGE